MAYVLPGLGRGGTEKHVRDLAAGIDRKRFPPCVISTGGGGPVASELADLGVPVFLLEYRGLGLRPGAKGPPPREAFAFFRRLAEILRERDVRIVHSYLPAGNVLGTAAALLARVPVRIVSKRALCRYKKGHPVFSLLEDMANLASRAVTVNSRAVGEDVRRHERFVEGKVRLIYNGIDSAYPTAAPVGRLFPELGGLGEGPVIACVSNLFPNKGHRDLVEAARRVVEEFPEARFLLVGRDAGEMGAVRARIESLGLGGHVLLPGPSDDPLPVLASSAIVAHPSHEEGFSNTILEAMAAERAVVATNVGGTPEAVADGETGILVPPGDPKALASALVALLRDPERARRMGEAGRARVVGRFLLKDMISRVEGMYEELLPRGEDVFGDPVGTPVGRTAERKKPFGDPSPAKVREGAVPAG